MKIKGFGGVFWRTRDVKALKKWYKEVFGISMENDWNGTVIRPEPGNETTFSLFTEEDRYFPPEQSVMLNFQVDSMDECLQHFKKIGVPLLKEPEQSEYGTFIWIADPDGRWIEIWENNLIQLNLSAKKT
ncbi:VOC family protein [Bacillus sp. T33-2]|uniref:VOC family protein n=1 Tax=Bacillus sp. T33-2 TaxID=2054168 RepID=UPI000C764750|nr:VOC family protein [Bacillus sp. T33-2]PLR92563.1 glyoxalase [Bacillus sp. T33-2]